MHRTAISILHLIGFLLIGIGMLGDALAGLAILNHHLLVGMLAHLIATLIWIIGLTKAHQPHIHLAAALGSILFPGMGILAWTLAGILAGLSQRQKITINDEQSTHNDLLADIHAAVEMPFETSLRPIAEVLHSGDSKIKRAALDLICRESSPQAMTLARGFLADPDSDVRALAAVAISRLESRMGELVKSALSQLELQPQDPECYAALGSVYFECAMQSANPMNRNYYFTQSRQAFENAVALDPAKDDARIVLADVLLRLNEVEKAWEVFAQALMKDKRPDPALYALGCEIAFRARRFDRMVDMAERGRGVLLANDETLPVLNWWLALGAAARH